MTYPLLRRFLAQQHTLGYARASMLRRVGAIHTFYRWACRAGGVRPTLRCCSGRPKVINRLPTVLRPPEAAEPSRRRRRRRPPTPTRSSDAVALRDRAVLELLYGSACGWVRSPTLTLDRIDLRSGRVLVLRQGLQGAGGTHVGLRR